MHYIAFQKYLQCKYYMYVNNRNHSSVMFLSLKAFYQGNKNFGIIFNIDYIYIIEKIAFSFINVLNSQVVIGILNS